MSGTSVARVVPERVTEDEALSLIEPAEDSAYASNVSKDRRNKASESDAGEGTGQRQDRTDV